MNAIKKRLLIVDDEAGLTRLIKLNLERIGRFDVKVVNESPRAFIAAQIYQPDLILLDLEMPEMNGDEVLRSLERDPGLDSIPVVLFSASAGKGWNDLPAIPKPVSLNRLISTIDMVLAS